MTRNGKKVIISKGGKRWKINHSENSNEISASDHDDDISSAYDSDNSQEEKSDGEQQPVKTRGPNKGADVPENPDDRPTIIAIANKFPDTRVTSDISMILKSNYNGFWPTWRHVPQEIKDLFWKQFKMHYKWAPWHNTQIYNAWKKTNSDRFRNLMSDERKNARVRYGENKVAWKKYKPGWISSKYWARLIDEVWNTTEWTRRSGSGKKNRLMGNEKADATWTGGSIPMCAYKEKLMTELEREPTELELFDRTHKTEQGKGDFLPSKAKLVRENYDKKIEERFPDEETRPPFDPTVWSEACEGTPKQTLYGFGSTRRGCGILGSDHAQWAMSGGTISDRDESDKRMEELEKMFQDTQQKNADALDEVKQSMKDLEANIPRMMRRVIEDLQNDYDSEGSDDQISYEESDQDMDMNVPKKNRVYARRHGKGGHKKREDDEVEMPRKKKAKSSKKTR